MKIERPRFELTRIYSDGSQEPPEIVPVTEMPWDTKMSRRGALGFGLTAAALLLLLKGCSDEQNVFTTQTAKEVDLQDSPEAQKKSPASVLKAHKEAVWQLIFSADSGVLVSSSQDDTVKQWSMPEGNLMGTISEKSLKPVSLKITPDGKTLLADLENALALWSLPQGTLLKKISETLPPSPRVPVTISPASSSLFALAPDGKTFALARGSAIKLYSLPAGELLATLTGEAAKNILSLSFTPDGKTLVSGAVDEEFKLWSLPDGKLLGKLAESRFSTFSNPSFSGNPLSVLINPESTKLAMLINGQIRLWSLPDGDKIDAQFNPDSTSTLIMTPDGKMLISVGKYSPKPVSPDASPTFATPPPAFPGSSSTYPYPSATPPPLAIKVQSFPEMQLLTVGKIKSTVYSNINQARLAPTPDGKTLIAAFYGGQDLWLLSLPDLRLETVFKGTTSGIGSFTVSPDGKFLAAGDYNGTIMLWDLEKKEFLSYLFDKTANTKSVKGVAYNVRDKVTGRTITYTLPCGSPIPPGAICTCNCVPGTYTPYTPPPPKPRRPRRSIGGGTYCACNKVCVCIPVPSDRNVKESFETTDQMLILQRLLELPIQKWNYKWDEARFRHIGPMAQDFAAAFGVGEDDKHIHPVDAQGVAFAAIQAVYQLIEEKDKQTQNLETQLRGLLEENQELKSRIESLEQRVK